MPCREISWWLLLQCHLAMPCSERCNLPLHATCLRMHCFLHCPVQASLPLASQPYNSYCSAAAAIVAACVAVALGIDPANWYLVSASVEPSGRASARGLVHAAQLTQVKAAQPWHSGTAWGFGGAGWGCSHVLVTRSILVQWAVAASMFGQQRSWGARCIQPCRCTLHLRHGPVVPSCNCWDC